MHYPYPCLRGSWATVKTNKQRIHFPKLTSKTFDASLADDFEKSPEYVIGDSGMSEARQVLF